MNLKRTFECYLFSGLWVLFTIFKAFTSTIPSAKPVWIAVVILAITLFVNMIVRPNYFEVIQNKLLINKDFFSRKSLELDEIEKVLIRNGVFESSKVVMKNKSEIRFKYRYVNSKDFQELMNKLRIPIE